jgi:fructose-bisphosphate aldolase class I
MDTEKLIVTAKALVADDKGLLAMDESTASCNKRFAKLGIEETEEARRAWRELIITTPNLSDCISGVILYDETIRQAKKDKTPFVKVIEDAGIIVGIKVDLGLKDFEGPTSAQGSGVAKEKITDGLDGLPERLAEYYNMGARFAKWRADIAIDNGLPAQAGLPTKEGIEENAKILAQYAFMCQEAGIVPMVEPEVLMDGSHTMEQCRLVTENVLRTVFRHLAKRGVALEGMILKPNMVVPGLDCPKQESVEEVAEATVNLFLQVVPTNVGGIAFLSGGQSSQLASERLNAMNKKFKSRLPWPLTFSYSRAIQYPAIEIWQGKEENRAAAQESLLAMAKANQDARRGTFKASTSQL